MSCNNDNYMVMVFCEIARRLPQTRSARPLVVELESARGRIFVGGAILFREIDRFVRLARETTGEISWRERRVLSGPISRLSGCDLIYATHATYIGC